MCELQLLRWCVCQTVVVAGDTARVSSSSSSDDDASFKAAAAVAMPRAKGKGKKQKKTTIYSVCLLPLDLRRLTRGLMWIHMHELTRMCRLNSCCLSPTKSHLCDDELTAGRTSQRILILQFIGMKLSIKWFCTPCVFTLRGLPRRLLFSFLYDPSIELEYHTTAPVDAASGPV